MMEERNESVNIILEGFMGCGKTTVGKIVASLMNFTFVDTDKEVELKAGIPIREMLEAGELAAFRQWEREVCKTLAGQSRLVIATGGGVFTSSANAELLRKHGMVVCLERDFELLYPVISEDPDRTLAYGKSSEEVRRLLENRRECYHQFADAVIENNGEPEEAALRILKAFADRKME